MALKVSINLPGDTVITFEADDPQTCREVLHAAIKELPRDILRMSANGEAVEEDSPTKNGAQDAGVPAPVAETKPAHPPEDEADSQPASDLRPEEEAFRRFCHSTSATGDMRRAIVSAEGARRYLGASSVSGEDLGPLFDLAGWMRPPDLLQTLRNAARTKSAGWNGCPANRDATSSHPRGRAR